MRNKNQSSAAPSMTSGLRSNEPSTAGGRELRLKARPPARFNSLRSERTVNQKQEPLGNTLLAQRYTLSGNSYFWRATDCRQQGLLSPKQRSFFAFFALYLRIQRTPPKVGAPST